jgi:hypothetical protein
LFEDLKRHPQRTVEELYRFLDLGACPPSNAEKIYNASASRAKDGGIRAILRRAYRKTAGRIDAPANMPAETRKRLIYLFEENIRETQNIIDRDLHHWLI